MLRRLGTVAVTFGLLAAPLACTTVLIPPGPDALKEPATVYVLDHGRTASLVLPNEHGDGMTRYAYGDWNWYALGNEGPLDGIAALLWPTRGTLGRKQLPGRPTAADIREQVHVPIDHLYGLAVEREATVRLRAELDRIFEQNRHTRVVNESAELEFVHHPRPYCAFNNSNHAVADWVSDMGVRVRGLAGFSQWAMHPRNGDGSDRRQNRELGHASRSSAMCRCRAWVMGSSGLSPGPSRSSSRRSSAAPMRHQQDPPPGRSRRPEQAELPREAAPLASILLPANLRRARLTYKRGGVMSLQITSEAFAPNDTIPSEFTADGRDISPALHWGELPPRTKELALIVDDPDAPREQPFVHWVMYKIPADAEGLPESVPKQTQVKSPPGALQGKNSFGKIGYGGPAPPSGHGTHHYHFHLYALDKPLQATGGMDKESLIAAMSGHILDEGDLVGTYQRR